MPEEQVSNGPLESELTGASPHISDYWQVISRRLWLVVLIFGVTTASAIWAVSQQRMIYQANASLQINDPLEVTRGLTTSSRLSGLNIYVDPIESEIQVLASAQVARNVVADLGMRLRPENPNLVRSDLFLDARVDPATPDGSLQLVYDEESTWVQLFDFSGVEIAAGPVGSALDGRSVRLTPRPPPTEDRLYGLRIYPIDAVRYEVQGRLVATSLESTNIVQVSYRGPDPILAPKILNSASAALQGFGRDKVRDRAERELSFIEQRLDSAMTLLQESSREIRRFKERARFTDLSIQEQQLLNDFQRADDRMQALIRQQDALQSLTVSLEASGAESVDLVGFLAILPSGVNPQIQGIANEVQERKDEVQVLVTEERKTADHPQVRAVRALLATKENELRAAVDENLVVLAGQIENQQGQLGRI